MPPSGVFSKPHQKAFPVMLIRHVRAVVLAANACRWRM